MKIKSQQEYMKDGFADEFGIEVELTENGVWFEIPKPGGGLEKCLFVTSVTLGCVLDDIKALREEQGDE